MDNSINLLLAADSLLALHTMFIAFVVSGPFLVLLGHRQGWSWVRNRGYRVVHLLCIAGVVAQAWLGRICPLTIWETELRIRAGEPAYDNTFIGYWLGQLIYFDAPLWVFALIYTLFGLLVAATWYYIPPRPFR